MPLPPLNLSPRKIRWLGLATSESQTGGPLIGLALLPAIVSTKTEIRPDSICASTQPKSVVAEGIIALPSRKT